MTISMHSLLQKTEVAKEVCNSYFPRPIQIRRDTSRLNQTRYIVLWQDEFETKCKSNAADSYYIEPVAELIVKNAHLRYVRKPFASMNIDVILKNLVSDILDQGQHQLLA
ncbi:hypothetical protein [Aeromonas sp. EERV15]|uniref:hypothetical protein n=1 Tax=Aeromonas sp. EERV15 TaxID=1833892 RepID=UPI00083B3F53|nr:hypothetical protein [Aeromonas sp. EERV15]